MHDYKPTAAHVIMVRPHGLCVCLADGVGIHVLANPLGMSPSTGGDHNRGDHLGGKAHLQHACRAQCTPSVGVEAVREEGQGRRSVRG